MPAQWTGDLIGKMHNYRITRKQLAEHLGLNEKYVLHILNGRCSPENAEKRFEEALDELIAQKSEN